jgi:hypothetical protein
VGEDSLPEEESAGSALVAEDTGKAEKYASIGF